MAVCPNCEGTGKKVVEAAIGSTGMYTCPSCRGTGTVSSATATKRICEACDGLGFKVDAGGYRGGFTSRKGPCGACGGTGLV